MTRVCAVRLSAYGRLRYADPGDLELSPGDLVLLPTGWGPRVAEVVVPVQSIEADLGPLPALAGRAGSDDIERDRAVARREEEAAVVARRLVREHGLDMRVGVVEFAPPAPGIPDGQLTIHFTAPHRVDFRALVRDLGRTLHTRVELRQVRERQHARLTGGVGACGRDLCCARLLADFPAVSVRMTKDQGLPMTPGRGSGACGRPMCCLAYEHGLYDEFRQTAPPLGAAVTTPEGVGQVVGYQVPAERVLVRLGDSGRRWPCPRAACRLQSEARDAPGVGG